MRKILFILFIASLACLTSCSENDIVNDAQLRIYLDLPMNVSDPVLTGATAQLTNIETLKTCVVDDFSADEGLYVANVVVPEGHYNIVVTGEMSYTVGTSTTSTTMRAAIRLARRPPSAWSWAMRTRPSMRHRSSATTSRQTSPC